MLGNVSGGAEIYYVPTCDAELGRYVPVRDLDRELSPAGLPVLALRVSIEGRIAECKHGSYRISQEAYEAQKARTLSPLDMNCQEEPSYSGLAGRLRKLFGSGFKGGLAPDALAPRH